MVSNGLHPVVIVTGANTGLGFGICHRLIIQSSTGGQESAKCDGLTLILACRSKQRAEDARNRLRKIAEEHVRRAKSLPGYDGHAESFHKNLQIVIHTVDLANVQSIFRFADEVSQTYPYVSHLICNAGILSCAKIIWPLLFWQMLTDFMGTYTTPKYFVQHIGEVSKDGLGFVWQCNVYGHYILFRALEPMMAKYTSARVVWVSSHEASSEFYNPKDWQLVKSEHSYQCSKYQMNMMSLYLDRKAIREQVDGTPTVRHFTVYPGVVGTSIASALLGTFTTLCMYPVFYLVRLLGSPNHPIDIFKAAVSAVHVSLTSLACLSGTSGISVDPKESVEAGAAYVSKTNRWGREFVETTKVVQSQEEEVQTEELLENYGRLLKAFCDIHGRASPSS